MRNTLLLRSTILLATLALAVPVFAKPKTTTLPIAHPVRVGQVEVMSGDYRVGIDDNHLTLFKGKQTIAQADGRWEERNTKSEYTEIISSPEGKLIELRFAGKKSAFVLTQ